MIIQVPEYAAREYAPKSTKYCLCIPVINEGERLLNQIKRLGELQLDEQVDVIICDGGSSDGSTQDEGLQERGVNTLLVKTGPGKLSAQLRMGYYWALQRGYEGIITMDGNGKDSVESIPLFIEALDEGFDMVQGSRYIKGGEALNTPLFRHWAVKMVHIPMISQAAGFRYTDTTNGFRAYSKKYLLDQRVQPFRDIFSTYELLAYLSVRAPQLGFKTGEVPVRRIYPGKGRIPTKISFVQGNLDLMRILMEACQGRYNPSDGEEVT